MKNRNGLVWLKQKLLPQGSRREQIWVELRQLARLIGREGVKGILQYLRLKRHGEQLLFPAWWLMHTIRPMDNQLPVFLHALDIPSIQGIVVIYAATPYQTSEGQRSTWLARAFLRAGWAVIYGYWRWSPSDREVEILEQGKLLQLPLDELWAQSHEIFSSMVFGDIPRLFLVEFPHPSLFNMINLANAFDWFTIYDRIDDWLAFYQKGQAAWYDVDFERYLVRNVTRCSITTKSLGEAIQEWGIESALLIPNAYEPGAFSILPSGRLGEQPFTVGYFGHLTSAWFDWDLIIQLAEKRTEWIIELIGPGLPPRSIPDNIHLTGRLPHAELADHAAHWNVAIIPFQEGDLSRSVDPIKVYEYLALGKPVVVTGMPHLSQMPYVYPAQSTDEFEEMILEASGMTLDEQVIARFLSENNWDQRIKVMLQEISPSFQLFAGGSGNSTGDQP